MAWRLLVHMWLLLPSFYVWIALCLFNITTCNCHMSQQQNVTKDGHTFIHIAFNDTLSSMRMSFQGNMVVCCCCCCSMCNKHVATLITIKRVGHTVYRVTYYYYGQSYNTAHDLHHSIVCNRIYTCHAPMIHPPPSPISEVFHMHTIFNPIWLL